MIIYHNPRCSKSRQAVTLLEGKGVDFKIVEYLKSPLNAKELRELKGFLGAISVQDFVRKNEDIYKELRLQDASEDEVIEAIAEHPILLERPIVVAGTKAVIGRPPENVLKLI